jgi:hypothetical protein
MLAVSSLCSNHEGSGLRKLGSVDNGRMTLTSCGDMRSLETDDRDRMSGGCGEAVVAWISPILLGA